MQPLLERVQKGEINPGEVISHRLQLDDAEYGYQMFREKEDRCIKVVMKP
jgi:threonine dehydrogenase-like Zn-dependent dehydrogenase